LEIGESMTSGPWLLKTQGAHRERLEKAAGVARVELVCAAGTWKRIESFCQANHRPGLNGVKAAVRDGMVHADLDGPQVAWLLQRSRISGSLIGLEDTAGRALARRVYEATAEVVDGVSLKAIEGKFLPPITLDARVTDRPNYSAT
jgi:hypothetical protein